MIAKISERIAYFFSKRNFFNKEDMRFYVYGFYYIISESIYWAIIALMAVLTNKIIETIAYLFVFINMRHYSGGYHADTRAKCNIIFTATYLIFLITIHFTPYSVYQYLIFAGMSVSYAVLLIKAPIENERKKCTSEERKIYRKKMVVYGIIFLLISFLCGISDISIVKKVGVSLTLGMINVSVSVLISICMKGGKLNEVC